MSLRRPPVPERSSFTNSKAGTYCESTLLQDFFRVSIGRILDTHLQHDQAMATAVPPLGAQQYQQFAGILQGHLSRGHIKLYRRGGTLYIERLENYFYYTTNVKDIAKSMGFVFTRPENVWMLAWNSNNPSLPHFIFNMFPAQAPQAQPPPPQLDRPVRRSPCRRHSSMYGAFHVHQYCRPAVASQTLLA